MSVGVDEMVKLLGVVCVEVIKRIELLCIVGPTRTADERVATLGMTTDEDAGISINGDEVCGSGRYTEVGGSGWTGVVGTGTLVDAVDLRRGIARVDDARRAVVDASSELSAPKSFSTSSVPSLTTSLRSRKSPMAFGGGLEDLCRSANSGRVKLETMFVVSSTQRQLRSATRCNTRGAIAAIVSGSAVLNTVSDTLLVFNTTYRVG